MAQSNLASKPYHIDLPGFAQAVAGSLVEPRHRALLSAIQGFRPLSNAQLVTTRGDAYLSRRKVLSANGELVHNDLNVWLSEQLEQDGGHAPATLRRLLPGGYLLSKCEIETLYVIQDRHGANRADFIQVEVNVENEFIDCPMFELNPFRGEPKDLRDLVNMHGCELPAEARHRVRPTEYRLRKVLDIAKFVDELEAVQLLEREQVRSRRWTVTTEGRKSVVTQDQLSPGWDKYPVKTRRLFADWSASSAGLSGERLCMHWAAQIGDYTDSTGKRSLDYIPLWTFDKKLAKIEGSKGGIYELFGKLEKLDARVKVPFGWYFYMLHGNRVGDVSARRILEGAESGFLVLPEHDYRVLKAWAEQPYGF